MAIPVEIVRKITIEASTSGVERATAALLKAMWKRCDSLAVGERRLTAAEAYAAHLAHIEARR